MRHISLEGKTTLMAFNNAFAATGADRPVYAHEPDDNIGDQLIGRNFMKLYLTILLMLCASTALAVDWQEYFHSQADSRHFIDRNSVTYPDKHKVRAWEKMVSANGNGNRSLTEVDCKQRMYTIRAMAPLDANDFESLKVFDIVMKGWTDPEQVWNYIDSSDRDEALYNTWCGKQPKKGKN
jgi:hypothetical protein